MMPDKQPSMPFFVSDYLSNTDVLLMSLAERGLYTHLLFRQWQDGRLEFDTRDLSILCACSEPEFIEQWEGVKHKFVTDSDGRIYNRRAEAVKVEYTRLREVRSEAGSKGGSKTQANAKQTSKQSIKQTAAQTSSKNQPPVQSNPVQSSPKAVVSTEPSRSVEEKEEKKHRPSTDRPTDSRNNGYRPSLAEAGHLNSLMFCATGKAETTSTAHAWLKTTRSAGSFERIKQVLEIKLRKHKPKSNAWFKTVLTDQFGISPEEAKAERLKFIERYREAIRLTDPDKRKAAAQACSEEAAEAGVSVLDSI